MSAFNAFNNKIIAEFRANEGRVGGPFAGAPMVLVHHVGARTGTERVAPLVATIDAACREAGRPPEAVARTVALYIGFVDTPRRRTGGEPLDGNSDDILRHLAVLESAGIGHVQAVLDPIVPDTIEKLGEIAARFRRDS